MQSARERARRGSCINNLKQIGLGLMQYSQDNKEKMPWGKVQWTKPGATSTEAKEVTRDLAGAEVAMNLLRYGEYLSDGNMFACPSSSAAGEDDASTDMAIKATDGTLSYGYGYVASGSYTDSGISSDLTHIDSADKNPNHTNYGNILFFDGHVGGFNGAGWFSRENAGYPESSMDKANAIPPSTLRNASTGKE
ncbi:MAG: DUF1559 domain-containing protein [Lentisphaeria bacterium]|nr:DUF1559 domain-containing protein [Lentisphaeria bacterium]